MLDAILHAGRDRSVRRRHPWILSGAVSRLCGAAGEVSGAPGDEVRVLSDEGEILGYGHLSPFSTLRIRLTHFGKELPESGWLGDRIRAALRWRRACELLQEGDALRLLNAEGDALPGLVADLYHDTVVLKLTSAGMHARRDEIVAALRAETGAARCFERADGVACRREQIEARQGAVWGDEPPPWIPISERGRGYLVDVRHGQKTGFYLDQRDARDRVQSLAAGRRVLDLFCYTGGFSLSAALGGAAAITAVDSSAEALGRVGRHLTRAGSDVPLETVKADAFGWLRDGDERFDLVVLDPPPLARQKRDVQRATRAYKDLALHALRRCAPGAWLLAFCCSHHVGRELFRKVVFSASLDAGRSVQVLAELGAPADHPVSLDHPEGDYLCGLLLRS